MDTLDRATYASASVRALPEVAVADAWRQAPASIRMRGTVMPGHDHTWVAPSKRSVQAAIALPLVACTGHLRADDTFSTRLGLSASPPV